MTAYDVLLLYVQSALFPLSVIVCWSCVVRSLSMIVCFFFRAFALFHLRALALMNASVRSLSHRIFWHTMIFRYDLFRLRHLPLRTLYRTNCILYGLSSYELFLTSIWQTNLIHTIFWPDVPLHSVAGGPFSANLVQNLISKVALLTTSYR